MSYTALYRKYRPAGFEDVKGQDAIVRTLKNQINASRVGHAYLFCGTRGTGKTSIAKIFAKAVNCEHPVDGSPCNECPACRSIGGGNSMNVVEIDAASNNGVDNIREIRDEVQYSPTEGKYRVYIIDEVHMLSTGAFNALLKTLEEPPAYVIFILATTEVHKIPITVLSRCQRYDFKRITLDVIADNLKRLMDSEGIETEDKALGYIAKAGDGSMRDSISLLDQCIAFHMGEKLTYENVLDVLGAVDTRVFSELFRNILNRKMSECMYGLEEIVMQGRDLTQFVIDFTWYLRNLLLLQTAEGTEELLEMSSDQIAVLKVEAMQTDSDTLVRFIRIFSELSNQMKYAAQKRILLELTFIKLSRPQMEQNLDSVLQRLSALEKQMESGVNAARLGDSENGKSPPSESVEEKEEMNRSEGEEVVLPKAQLRDLTLVREEWNKIINELGMSIRPAFKETVVEPAGEGRLSIVFRDGRNYNIGSRPNILEEIKLYVAGHYEREIEFSARLIGGDEVLNTRYVSDEELKENILMDIVIEED